MNKCYFATNRSRKIAVIVDTARTKKLSKTKIDLKVGRNKLAFWSELTKSSYVNIMTLEHINMRIPFRLGFQVRNHRFPDPRLKIQKKHAKIFYKNQALLFLIIKFLLGSFSRNSWCLGSQCCRKWCIWCYWSIFFISYGLYRHSFWSRTVPVSNSHK